MYSDIWYQMYGLYAKISWLGQEGATLQKVIATKYISKNK